VSHCGHRDGTRDDRQHERRACLRQQRPLGYARVSTRAQEHQAQLDALAAAHCREVIVEIASTRGDRPKLREALGQLQAGDRLVIYKPDRVARSMKELLVLLEAQLHAHGINLHIHEADVLRVIYDRVRYPPVQFLRERRLPCSEPAVKPDDHQHKLSGTALCLSDHLQLPKHCGSVALVPHMCHTLRAPTVSGGNSRAQEPGKAWDHG
jgi:hypothetical protein